MVWFNFGMNVRYYYCSFQSIHYICPPGEEYKLFAVISRMVEKRFLCTSQHISVTIQIIRSCIKSVCDFHFLIVVKLFFFKFNYLILMIQVLKSPMENFGTPKPHKSHLESVLNANAYGTKRYQNFSS